MLRTSFLNRIDKMLGEHPRFEINDFEVLTKNNGTTIGLTINYLGDDRYSVLFEIPNRRDNGYFRFRGEMKPGTMSLVERVEFTDENEIQSRIFEWQSAIWDELVNTPLARAHQESRAQVEEMLNNYNFTSQEFFTKIEADDIKVRLDDLEKKMKEKFELSNLEKDVLESELENLHNDIATLKETIQSLKKGFWSKSLFTKMFKWGSKTENRELIEGGYEMIKGILESPSGLT